MCTDNCKPTFCPPLYFKIRFKMLKALTKSVAFHPYAPAHLLGHLCWAVLQIGRWPELWWPTSKTVSARAASSPGPSVSRSLSATKALLRLCWEVPLHLDSRHRENNNINIQTSDSASSVLSIPILGGQSTRRTTPYFQASEFSGL